MVAEMNGLPGPRHVLDAAASLSLTDTQISAVQEVFNAMHATALPAGERFLAAQEALEADLRAGQVTSETLRSRLSGVEQLRTELALVHITAHLRTAAILTPEQRARYDIVRGHHQGVE
jgi:Spy/CpxP family protein refolding chaperone